MYWINITNKLIMTIHIWLKPDSQNKEISLIEPDWQHEVG